MTELLPGRSVLRPASPLARSPRRIRRGAWHPAFWPGVAAALGLLVSLIGIVTPSIWYDEAASISGATRSLPELWTMAATVDAVHAAYYALLHLIFSLVGYSPFTLRLPSALAVAATAALVVVLGRQLGRPRLGAIAGVVFCLLPRVAWMGAEGRSFAIAALLAVTLTCVLVRATRSAGWGWWVVYGGLVVLACVVFLYLALIVVAHAVSVACQLFTRRGAAMPASRRWFAATSAAVVAVSPFALVVMAQSDQVGWLGPLGDDTSRHVFQAQWFYTSVPFALVGWLLLGVGTAVLARSPAGPSAAAVLLPALVVPTVALLATTATLIPVYSPRYLAICLPFVALVMAAAIDSVPSRAAAPVALLLLAALVVPQVALQRRPEHKDQSSWNQVASLIAAERADDGSATTSAVIFGTVQRHPLAGASVIAYAYPDAFEGMIDVTLETPAGEAGTLWERRYELTAPTALLRVAAADVTYLVTSVSRDRRPATIATMARHGWHVEESWRFTRVHVLRFERD